MRRAIERRALWLAEDAACELPNLPLEDALRLVYPYAERGSPKYEKAAMRWLERYITEGSPKASLRVLKPALRLVAAGDRPLDEDVGGERALP